jgi:Rieske Fe-S protein
MTDRHPVFDRRRALTGAATLGLALPVLAACSGGGNGTATDPSGSGGLPTGHKQTASGKGALTTTDKIPVDGGVIFPDQQVVVTQPTAGTFKCFSAICTHQGCIVSSVQAGGIFCGCHGSAFSIADGSVVNPPAIQPLPEKQITVKGKQISLG